MTFHPSVQRPRRLPKMRLLVTLLSMSTLAGCASMKGHGETLHATKPHQPQVIGERRWTSNPRGPLPMQTSDWMREEAAAMEEEMRRIQEQADQAEAQHP